PEEREAPAGEEDGEENAAVEADIGLIGRDAGAGEKVAECGDQHERVDEGVHAVERPTGPGGPETADLIGGERKAGADGRGTPEACVACSSVNLVPFQL